MCIHVTVKVDSGHLKVKILFGEENLVTRLLAFQIFQYDPMKRGLNQWATIKVKNSYYPKNIT